MPYTPSTGESAKLKMREAGLWWDNFDQCIKDYRATIVRHRMFKKLLETERAQRFPNPAAIDYLRKQEEACHDWMLHIRDNIETSVKCAVACEIAARIYWEEIEGLELSLLTRTDRFERG